MAHFTAIAGSIAPAYSAVVVDGNGAVVDLTSATAVALRLRHGATDEVVEYALVVGTPAAGEVSRSWSGADLDIRPGTWWAQWRVTRATGTEIWPNPSDADPCNHLLGWHGLEVVICPANPDP